MSQDQNALRKFVAISFTALLLVQLLQVAGIRHYTPVMRQFWDWYELDLSSLLLFQYHQYHLYWLLPLVTVIVGFDVLRREAVSIRYASIAFGLLAALTLAVQFVMIRPLFEPIEMMIINR